MPQIRFSIEVGENLDSQDDDTEPVIVLSQRGLITLGGPEDLRSYLAEAKAQGLLETLWDGIQAHLDFGGGYDNLKQQLELAKKHAEREEV